MIEVIASGLFSTIQDSGRLGYRQYGVPVSGAMDTYSAGIANLILGNSVHEPVLEMTVTGPELLFLTSCRIAIAGAHFNAKIDGDPVERNRVIVVEKDQTLKFGSVKSGMRAYLAVDGGFDSELVLGSTCYLTDITAKERILKGDQLYFKKEQRDLSVKNAFVRITQPNFESEIIEVMPGPEFNTLSETVKRKILTSKLTVSSQSNRMGYRLTSKEKLSAPEIITGPVLPGTVQLTPSGQMIILGRDAQTTGGYSRVLQLTEMAQNLMAQKQFGSVIQFHCPSLDIS